MSSILVIGGNSDMGYAAAKIFAKNNFDIHLVSRNIEQLNIKKEEILIKLIGLNKGEKLFEELSISKKFIKTSNKDIIETDEPNYREDEVKKLILKLENNLYNKNQYFLKKTIFSFLSREK